MPKRGGGGGGRGRKGGHKGQARKFNAPEEMAAQMKEEEVRRERGDDGEERGAGEELRPQDRAGMMPPSDSDDESSSEEEGEGKAKGVEHLIEIENPNRRVQKMQKAVNVNVDEGVQNLSRREREEIEKSMAKERYMKAHAAGKTDEARADLARLAIIKKQREDAAKKRELEKAKEAAALKAKSGKK